MKKYNTIIVDDEKGARESLAKMVEKYCPQIEVVAKADSMLSAYSAITSFQPDLVFLDIEMPNGNAFDLLEKLGTVDFDIIFTTAYDHYAIKAIKFSAIDYILKPIDPEELVQAVNKLDSKAEQKFLNQKKFDALLSNLRPESKSKKLAINEGDSLVFISVLDIIRCEATSNYTLFVLANGREILGTKILSEYEQMFADEDFMRVHRSHLINLKHIKKFRLSRTEKNVLTMSDDSEVEVSRRAKQELLDRISTL